MISASHAARALVPAIGALAVLLAPIEMDGHARSALAIAVGMVLCWVTDVLHPALVAFIGCFLFRATADVEFETAFAGFATATPWFLYGTLLLVSAADRSGLIFWLGAGTPRVFVTSLMAGSIALVAVSYLLAFVVPSSLARATLVSMLAMAWARQLPNQTGAPMAWLVLVAAYSAAMFGHADMPGGPAAIVGWDVAAATALLAGVFWLSTAEPRPPSRPEDPGPLRRGLAEARDGIGTRAEAANALDPRLGLPVAIAAGLWVTTPLHGISPALVGLGSGLVCRLPGFAPSRGKPAIEPDPLAVIVVGAAISIPAVLVETKAADALWQLWVNGNQGGGLLPDNLAAYWSTTAYRLFSPDGAQRALPALVGPSGVLQSSAAWAYAGSTLLALHQSPAVIFGMSVGGFRARHILAVGLLVLAAGSFIVVVF